MNIRSSSVEDPFHVFIFVTIVTVSTAGLFKAAQTFGQLEINSGLEEMTKSPTRSSS